jgi:hypothetical protein
MQASQLKFLWGEIGRIAPLMHLTPEEYKFQLGVEVLKNTNGSISKCSMAGFMALKYRLLEDGRKVSSVGTTAEADFPSFKNLESLEKAPFQTNFAPNPQNPQKRGGQADLMRKKLLSMSYTMGWASAGDWKTAINQIGVFVQGSKSIFKKPLMHHSVAELSDVVTQFEQMLKHHYKQVRSEK